MRFDNSWAKVLGLALSLPSTIIGSALLLRELHKRDYLPFWVTILLFLLIVCNTLFLIVYYAYRRKKTDSPIPPADNN